MTKNIKILLSILLIFGFAIVLKVGLFIQKHVYGAKAQTSITERQSRVGCVDSDHDGLCDSDETFYETDPFNPDTDSDGVPDGREAAAGCNPRLPAPNNNCPSGPKPKTNLTQETASLIAGGVLSGDLKPSNNSDFENNINALSVRTLLDVAGPGAKESVSDSDLTIINDSDQNIANYLNTLSIGIGYQLLESATTSNNSITANFTKLISNTKTYKNTILAYAHTFNTSYNRLKQIPVPKSWKLVHKEILAVTKKYATIYSSLANVDSDPLRALSALTSLKSNTAEAQTILNNIVKNSQNLKILPNDSLFSVIKALNSIYAQQK